MGTAHRMAMLVKHLLPHSGNRVQGFMNEPLLIGLLDFYLVRVANVWF
jgi:hypothetical protein